MARSRGRNTTAASFILADDQNSNDDDGNAAHDGPSSQCSQQHPPSQFEFSQQAPDRSQILDTARSSEKNKLECLNPAARNRIVTDLSRILLFKGFNGDPIDRTKVSAEALGGTSKERVMNAALNEAEARLKDVFGFSVRRVPEKMETDLPVRFKNRLYLINDVADDGDGTHSLNIHSAHHDSTIEKGVLMMILAFAFCKGSSQVRSGIMKGAGKKTRWITEHHLYSLMHRVDENIPSEPPSVEGKKRSRSSGGGGRRSLDASSPNGGVGQTPDVDTLLERFVSLDYLLRDKIEEPGEGAFAGEDGKVIAYAMGPRAAMEVGRKQIIYFCSNVLEEQPDLTMLAEVDEDEEGGGEEEEEDGVQEEEQVDTKKGKKRR
mmetsp:Transcript_18273/g.29734  ORF Transcript_18273/g.29734 Transcript_18273/m.29734 type:complete len:377 (+) Transcript_18273:80-1210(+)|eukprot:CAMPEP_0201963586 /NCGR_PEP_ID=MMETSP0904-20121228/9439_1 /ASSEMBLY_ACC=CAM_ASM_000553 /TAXON_ID=420261 /ORGANISM="Thalassiosira antarctica, Strain CCMP982" /LENGTH=376 /DNA_ID=CAMNT_0048510241 /DNA_START=30 /DNA_END=1160 /DNA_ORIENTATION=+